MLQAALSNGVAFGPFSYFDDFLAAPEEDIGGGKVFQALVVAAVAIVAAESDHARG